MEAPRTSQRVHLLALVILGLTLSLMMLGGIVHSTGSSLACPDWPLCYGQVMPKMEGSVAIEHSHRLLASAVGFLTILLVIFSYRIKPRNRQLIRLTWLALLLVIFQGILGGITVIYQLPTAVSTAHLGTSMIFLMTILWIALTNRFAPRSRISKHRNLKRIVLMVGGAVYLQILLGALVRHTGAAIVCPDLPFCFGDPWPLHLHPTTQLHMMHRYFAVALLIGIVYLGSKVRRLPLGPAGLGTAMSLLVLVQLGLGLLSVWTSLAVPIVTAHLAVGAALLGVLLSTYFMLRKAPVEA